MGDLLAREVGGELDVAVVARMRHALRIAVYSVDSFFCRYGLWSNDRWISVYFLTFNTSTISTRSLI